MALSVQPTWCLQLPLQQQSVLLLAARGPDGISKSHPAKVVVRNYRGTVLVAAKYGRPLHVGEEADSFMSLWEISRRDHWLDICEVFWRDVDDLPLHYVVHLLHGAQILGYHHPDGVIRYGWFAFYRLGIHTFHLGVETREEMDARLSDWDRRHWEQQVPRETSVRL